MESKYFAELYQYFNTANRITYKNKKPYVDAIYNQIPLPEFQIYSFRLLSNFINEYNNNLEIYKDNKDFIIRELENIKGKFDGIFHMQFGVHLDDEKKQFNLNNFPENEINNDLESGMKIKWYVFQTLNDFLNRAINNQLESKKNISQQEGRRKAKRVDFWLKLDESGFVDFYEELIDEGFIDNKTSRNTFIDAFTGKDGAKIKWTGDQHSLYTLFQILNNNNCFRKKLNDNKWEIVSDVFSRNKEPGYFTPFKLAGSRGTDGKDYSTIEKIAKSVVEQIKNNNQFGI